MLRSVSHRFALVKRYLLDRFAFAFATCWVALYRVSACLPTLFCFSLAFACECSAFYLLRWFELYHVSALLSNPFMLRYLFACNMQDIELSL